MNGCSKEGRTRWLCVCVQKLAVTGLAIALFAGAAFGQGKSARVPDLGDCDNLQVPTGNKLFFRVYAAGVQIYRWNGTSWVFVAPEADLSANPGGTGLVGIHYAGPTWESVSGSKVVGAVEDRCTVSATDIQWLRLRAVSSEGPGVFHDVTFILRLYTSGGVAPTAPGTTVGQIARVPYATEYYFYRGHP
jgi:hypothetical protein